MAKVRETVEIDAPIDRVWAVVHEDFENAAKWTSGLHHIDVLTDGPFGKGTELRYTINTGAGMQELEVEHTTVTAGKTVAGRFTKGPIKGTWRYAYAEKDGGTRLTYSMDYEPNGFAAKLFFGIIENQVPKDLVRTLANLKNYVESGKGPRAKSKR
ncbi:MAG: SRPBCC family protein [Candidatus Dormibacteraeota bacterium]|nr:SRPBCC family protein [Candidatus Dormibacteraeota bacterium]